MVVRDFRTTRSCECQQSSVLVEHPADLGEGETPSTGWRLYV